MGFMWLFWIFIIALIIWVVVRPGPGRGDYRPPEDSPEQILKRRYARGEIDKEEFDRRLADIRR